MAAKKKAAAKKGGTKKKSSKKKATKRAKPAAKKKTAKKSTRSPKKKIVKKSAASKSITRKKKAATAKKQSPGKKATSIKKAASKKKAPAKPKAIPPPPPPPPQTPVTPVARGGRPTLREVPSITAVEMNIEARFELGVGHIIAKQFRAGNLIDEDRIDISDAINFLDVRARDVVTINGVCAGTARIITDRKTIRPSDEAHPLEFDHEDIFANLIVL